MDYFQEDCAHVANQFEAEPTKSTNEEDRITRKRWARGLVAFYACVLLAGATAIGVTQYKAPSTGTEQHASLK
ncbi:hypothetical protein [Bradyrhizobium sp. McL0616]|uniref:hypothetical protein n=1 Tax=Bradyrhizobium sp. McL0616 TaxID=3415674 RepID=UPI003CE69A49